MLSGQCTHSYGDEEHSFLAEETGPQSYRLSYTVPPDLSAGGHELLLWAALVPSSHRVQPKPVLPWLPAD